MAGKCGGAEQLPHALDQLLPQSWAGFGIWSGAEDTEQRKGAGRSCPSFCLTTPDVYGVRAGWLLSYSSFVLWTTSWLFLEFNRNKYPNNGTLSIFMSVLLSADLVKSVVIEACHASSSRL